MKTHLPFGLGGALALRAGARTRRAERRSAEPLANDRREGERCAEHERVKTRALVMPPARSARYGRERRASARPREQGATIPTSGRTQRSTRVLVLARPISFERPAWDACLERPRQSRFKMCHVGRVLQIARGTRPSDVPRGTRRSKRPTRDASFVPRGTRCRARHRRRCGSSTTK